MSQKWTQKLPMGVLIALSMLALTGFGCRQPGSNNSELGGNPLVVWGLWQESAWVEPVIAAFKQQTGIDVEYKKIGSVASYEKMLLEALAEGRGPDVFVIHHTWVEGKRGLMSPAPNDIVNVRQIQEEFVPVVAQDLVRDNFVYALPTSVDSLALYYNQDILAASGIATPPKTWTEFQRAVEKITKVSRLGIIEQSAAALGTANNVNRAGDVLQLLMLQQGMKIVNDDDGRSDLSSDLGERALEFFTDFSNKSKRVFTWDLAQDFSIDAFAEGRAAMMVNYSYHIPTIKAKNARLRFAVAPVPQLPDSTLDNQRSFASYWPFAVAASSRSPQAGWQFVRFMTSAEASQVINQEQQAPPARRDVIPLVQSDPIIGVFADQSLVASTWTRSDIVTTDAIFNTMIDNVVTGASSIQDALKEADEKLGKLNQFSDDNK